MNPCSTQRPAVVFAVFQDQRRRADGGVESITQIVTRLRRCRPVLLTQFETPFNRRWREASLDVWVRSAPFAAGGSKNWLTRARRVADCTGMNRFVYQLLRNENATVLHCNDPASFWHGWVAAKAAGCRLVFNVRNTLGEPASVSKTRRIKWQQMFSIADRVIVLSEEMRDYFRTELRLPNCSGQKLVVVPGIVDTTTFYPVNFEERRRLRARLGIGMDECAIGYIAAFEPRKGQLDFLREIGARLLDLGDSARIHFFGDFDPQGDRYASACLRIVQDLGIDRRIHFHGAIDGIAEWYRALEIVVLASANEGLARCMIEAMASGTPVLSFDVCSAREMLELNGAGIVIRVGDYTSFLEALASLVRSAERRCALGAAGFSYAHRAFDPEHVAALYEAVYLQFAAEKPGLVQL